MQASWLRPGLFIFPPRAQTWQAALPARRLGPWWLAAESPLSAPHLLGKWMAGVSAKVPGQGGRVLWPRQAEVKCLWDGKSGSPTPTPRQCRGPGRGCQVSQDLVCARLSLPSFLVGGGTKLIC